MLNPINCRGPRKTLTSGSSTLSFNRQVQSDQYTAPSHDDVLDVLKRMNIPVEEYYKSQAKKETN